MTREEAIDRLRKISEKTPIRTNGDDLVAITMAIQALSQEPCERFVWGIDGNVYKITKAKDGKEICQQVCDDAISREDALKLIYDFKENHTKDREKHPINYGTLLDLIRLIRELPPVTQKSGKR